MPEKPLYHYQYPPPPDPDLVWAERQQTSVFNAAVAAADKKIGKQPVPYDWERLTAYEKAILVNIILQVRKSK